MTVFDRVKEIAKKRGLSLKSVNDTAGLGTNAIYKWKTQKPNLEALNSVADVLGVSTDYLLGNTDSTVTKRSEETPDMKKMLDGALTYDGKPLSESDRDVVRMFLESLKSEG